MRLIPLTLLFLASCATTGGRNLNVTWPDESEKNRLWTCFMDEEKKDTMICLDWGDFLRYMQKKAMQNEIEDSDYGPGEQL